MLKVDTATIFTFSIDDPWIVDRLAVGNEDDGELESVPAEIVFHARDGSDSRFFASGVLREALVFGVIENMPAVGELFFRKV